MPGYPVYSAVLWENGAIGAGTHSSTVVPTGQLWVVRDISVTVPGQIYAKANGFLVWSYVSGANIFAVSDGEIVGGHDYHWEGRQMLNAGDNIQFTCSTALSSIRICGYRLTVP